MRLTTFSDYSLRILVYLALHPNRFVTIAEIARAYGISANHLMKVTQDLSAGGIVTTLRGQHGGLRLARAAADIRVGEVIRRTEPDMDLLPCRTHVASLDQALPKLLNQALSAFMAVLDGASVADLAADPGALPALDRPREFHAQSA